MGPCVVNELKQMNESIVVLATIASKGYVVAL